MEFKDRVRSLRREHNITTTELAAHFGKSDTAIRMWETGRSKPDADTLIKLAKYFECTTDYLLGVSNDESIESVHAKQDLLVEFWDCLSKTGKEESVLSCLNLILWHNLRTIDTETGQNTVDVFFGILNNLARAADYDLGFVDSLYKTRNVNISEYSELAKSLEVVKRATEGIVELYFSQRLLALETVVKSFASSNEDVATIENISSMLRKDVNASNALAKFNLAFEDMIKHGMV
ncbi:MAG: helix-turn-helix domain-containing protein [Oscillospiraceae bacterium]|jgi:transcriptional regulator with XRE-family HTH domain|nr:helix-turn-helix domain-containing protein [Oscillospiraceae bacterium]